MHALNLTHPPLQSNFLKKKKCEREVVIKWGFFDQAEQISYEGEIPLGSITQPVSRVCGKKMDRPLSTELEHAQEVF